jgi:hypothetical protein
MKANWKSWAGNTIVFAGGAIAGDWYGWMGVAAVCAVALLVSYLGGFYAAWRADRARPR